MVTRLRPLDVKLVFQDRPYKLGETIDLVVELNARGDVEVRKGRVDLVCEVRYIQRHTAMVRVSGITHHHYGALPPQGVTDEPKPRQFIEERKKTYIRSSVEFLKEGRVRSGTMERYSARLKIPPKPPPHARRATFLRWQLVTALIEAGIHIRAVQSLLGHSSPSLTMAVYAHVSPGMDKDAAEAYAQSMS